MVGRNKGCVNYCKNYEYIDDCLSVKDEDFADQLKTVTLEDDFSM